MSSLSNNNQDLQEMPEDAYDLILQIRHMDRKYRRARTQMIILNQRIEALIVRHQRSSDEKKKLFCYIIRMQAATVEGVRNMFYEYAKRLCGDIDYLQEKLKELTGEIYDDFEEF